MRTTGLLFVILHGVGLAALAAPPRDAGEVPVPRHPALVAPGPEVPVMLVPLAGRWEGLWDGRPLVVVVYRLGSTRARLLVARGSARDPTNPPWHGFFAADVRASTQPSLSWRQGASTFRLTLEEPDRLRVSVDEVEGTPTGALRRRKVPLLARAPDERPPACPATRDTLAAIEVAPPPARRALVDALEARARAEGGPLVGPAARKGFACATFVWRGKAEEVVVAGDLNGWSRDRDRLARVAETDLFTRSVELPGEARLDYKFLLDGQWTLDPWNPRQLVGGYGPNSELTLPAYRAPPELTRQPATPRGTVEGLPLVSRHLGNRRKAQVVLPPGYAEGSARYPVVYLHDGEDELAYGAIDVLLDELLARGVLPPLIAVLVPPLERSKEYGRNPAFEAFFLEEVVPAVDERYRTINAPAGRFIGGASFGALAALSLGLGHPDVFGGILAHSGAYFANLEPLVALARQAGRRAPAVWMDVGTFEENMNGADLLAENRRLRDALSATGVRLRYVEVPEGHSWGNWRARKREALGFLLGR